MKTAIVRGIIYQNLTNNFRDFFQSLFARFDDSEMVAEFEDKFAQYLGSPYCVAFPYARVAIYYALKFKKFPKGTEIIMPPITIKAIYDVVIDLGLKPVFVDLDKDTLCFDISKLESALTTDTRAILITYLYGLVPNVEEMVRICKAKNLYVIEDFSQCLNGRYQEKKLGTYGDVGVYSSSSTKTLDTYGGGILVCNNEDLYQYLKQNQKVLPMPKRKEVVKKVIINSIRNIATNRYFFTFITFPILRSVEKRNPDFASRYLGERVKTPLEQLPNSWFTAFTSFQAKVGLRVLNKIDHFDSVRVKNVHYLRSVTPELYRPSGVNNSQNVYWQFINYFVNKDKDRNILRELGIDTAMTSLLNISSLDSYEYSKLMPNANYIYNYGYFVPCYPGLSQNDLDRLGAALSHISPLKEV